MKTVSSRTVIGLPCLFVFCMAQSASAAQEPGKSAGAGPTVGSGPYKAIMEMDSGLPAHTIYRPDDLSALGRRRRCERRATPHSRSRLRRLHRRSEPLEREQPKAELPRDSHRSFRDTASRFGRAE